MRTYICWQIYESAFLLKWGKLVVLLLLPLLLPIAAVAAAAALLLLLHAADAECEWLGLFRDGRGTCEEERREEIYALPTPASS